MEDQTRPKWLRSIKGAPFTGIAVYAPEFLDVLRQGVSPVTKAWERARVRGHRVGSVDVGGCAWHEPHCCRG